MKRVIAYLLGLKTQEAHNQAIEQARKEVTEQRREYYQKVLDHMHRDGTLPPNCDLKMPKQSLVLRNEETGELVAQGGKWIRLPANGEKLAVTYNPQ